MNRYDSLKLALESFKDWSNYLLITTVAAIGWMVAQGSVTIAPSARMWSILLLCFSALCAVLTLSLIPLVAESLTEETRSIYDVAPAFRPYWMWGKERGVKMKWVCWPQHVTFIAGILTYGIAAAMANTACQP